MAVTLFSVFLKQKKDLFRAYKKIDTKPYAEYFSNKDEANARQAELDKLGESSADWQLKNIFIQRPAAEALATSGSNIGIRHIYLRLQETRAGSGRQSPSIQFSAYNNRTQNKVVIKDFSLTRYGWPNALYAAVKFSFDNTVQEHEKVTLAGAFDWVRENEEDVAIHLWRMIGATRHVVLINSEITRDGNLLYTKLKVNKHNSIVLSTRLPHVTRSITVRDYDSLFQNAAYFTALQLMHREFANEVSYSSYAAGVYILLKGEWLDVLYRQGVPYEDYMGDNTYGYHKWKELINQWCDREYGQALLP